VKAARDNSFELNFASVVVIIAAAASAANDQQRNKQNRGNQAYQRSS
jgi:hypothetical protein